MANWFKREMTEAQRERWERVRRQGKLRFIFFRGILGYGVFMIIFGAYADKFIDHKVLAIHPVRSLFLISVGWFVGLWGWNDGENRFHRANIQPDLIKGSEQGWG
jgi:hypothetical protein